MTMQAVADFKMRSALMTEGAGDLCLCALRRMLRMTLEAADFRSMLPSPFGNHLQLKSVTFLAIIRLQFNSLSSKDRGSEADKQQGKHRAAFFAAKRFKPAHPDNKKFHDSLNARSLVLTQDAETSK